VLPDPPASGGEFLYRTRRGAATAQRGRFGKVVNGPHTLRVLVGDIVRTPLSSARLPVCTASFSISAAMSKARGGVTAQPVTAGGPERFRSGLCRVSLVRAGRMGEGGAMEVVEFPVDGGGVIYVEVAGSTGAAEDALGRAGFGNWVAKKATVSFTQALSTARATAEAVAKQFRGITPPPEEVEVTFGMKVTGGINASFIVAGGESNLNVRILWGKQVTEQAADPAGPDVS
jgi:hypothetical protein